MHPTTLVLTFSAALDPARAQDVSNYHLAFRGPDGRFGTRDDILIKVLSARYNDIDHTVTLRPARLLPLSSRYRLTVRGSGRKGITDKSETLLDGKSTGQPGSDSVTTISRSNFVFTKYSKKKVIRSKHLTFGADHSRCGTRGGPSSEWTSIITSAIAEGLNGSRLIHDDSSSRIRWRSRDGFSGFKGVNQPKQVGGARDSPVRREERRCRA